MIGEKILGYTVDEKIGSGGFGTVYKVSKTNASGTYIRALKHVTIPNSKQYADVLNSMGGDYSKADDYFSGVLKEIVNEIKIISTLSETGTKNIVRYYENDISESESPKRYDIYILMEYLTPFTDYLYQNELKVKDVIKLGKDILAALISCHAQKVIHRDIKDDNIFVSADGTYKLGDFGVSKMLKDRSRAESMKGTPNFIAPEVYLGKEEYDNTVDIYSLGIVLYKLLNKSRNLFLPEFPQAYNSNDEDLAFERRMKCEIPELPYDAKNILGKVIIKAIKKRDERYNSAEEFLNELIKAENELSAEELEKTINQVITKQPTEMKKQGINFDKDETVGLDIGFSENKRTDNKLDRDLFETVSDTYNKIPVKEKTSVNTDNSKTLILEENNVNYRGEELKTTVLPSDEQINVPAIKKSDFRWVAYVLPVFIAAVYIIIYLLILPNLYGKSISIGKWIFNNPGKLIEYLQDQDKVFLPIYAIWAFKIFMYLLWIGFVVSLINLGRTIHNKKPEYNIKSIVKDNEAYLKALELNEIVKTSNSRDANDAKVALRNVMEHLRNESAFGIGSDAVIQCETDIVKCLRGIEENLQGLFSDKTAKAAGDVIVENCRTIQRKLKIRTEMKKK